jgi:hypothetical protein
MWFRMFLRIAQSIAEGVPTCVKARISADFSPMLPRPANMPLAKGWDISP